MPWWGILLIVLAVVAAVLVILYFVGKKRQKQMDEQQVQIDAAKQMVSMLVIDKKKMKIKDAGMPQAVVDQVPKRMQWRKFPIVKAKVGPRIMSFITDPKIFDLIPVKKEIKAYVSGLYITEVKAARGGLEQPKKKKSGKLDTLLKKGRGEM